MSSSSQPAAPSVGWLVTLALVGCTAVSVLSTDLYTPSLPHLPGVFGTDASTVQLTMSLNMAAYAVAVLVHGLLADRYGPKLLLVIGMAGTAATSIACALAPSVEILIAGRIAQGLFASVPSVVVLLFIRALYAEDRAVKVMSFYGMAVGVAPALGPMIGGYVHVHAGWQAVFWLLAALALLATWAAVRVVPAPPRTQAPMPARVMIASYFRLLTVPGYLRYLIPQAMIFGALFAFITGGPFLLIDRMQVRTEDYGLYYAVIVLGFIGGSFVANRLAGSMRPDWLYSVGVLGASIGVAVLALPMLAGLETLIAVMAGMMVFAIGLGLIFATGPLLLLNAVAEYPQGPAAAMLGFAQLVCGSLGALMVGELHDGTGWPVAITMTVFVGLGGLGYTVLSMRRIRLA